MIRTGKVCGPWNEGYDSKTWGVYYKFKESKRFIENNKKIADLNL